jgi:hypothetical protein
MGNNLFGANISGKIAAALGSKLLGGKLTSFSYGAYNPLSVSTGNSPVVQGVYDFKGIIEKRNDYRFKGTAVSAQYTKILILADTLAVIPKEGDRIALENKNYTISAEIERDPDAATYTCYCTQN